MHNSIDPFLGEALLVEFSSRMTAGEAADWAVPEFPLGRYDGLQPGQGSRATLA